MRNSIPNITEVEVITTFVRGLHHHDLRSKFNRKPPKGIDEMIMTADVEEAKVRFNEDAGTHRLTRHSDEHPDDRHHSDRHCDDRDHHQDSGYD